MKPVFRKIAVVLAIFVATGLAKAPWEDSLDRRLTEAGLLNEPIEGVGWKQQLRQEILAALLGRLRSVMAVYFTLAGMEDWSNKDWPGVEQNFRFAADLNPDDADLWSFGAWHLHTNAASWWFTREDQPEAVREKEIAAWIRKGASFLKRGIEHHPKSAKLHSELAKLYLDKLEDPCLAADHYRLAKEGDNPLGYEVRFEVYAMALCSGREKQAYEMLMYLYSQGKRHRLPTLIKRIKMLEEKLEIPVSLRIPEPDPDEELLKIHPHAIDVLP